MSKTDKLATLIPIHEIEMAAQNQIYAVLDLPFVKRMAIMPDAHMGYEMPIGGVAVLDGKISPGFVGYDIGCGMCQVRTGRTASDLLPDENARQSVYKRLYEVIPTGLGIQHQESVLDPSAFSLSVRKEFVPDFFVRGKKQTKVEPVTIDQIRAAMARQFGTLGSGNHFLEIGRSEENGEAVVTIHSGSRRPGWLVAELYMLISRHGQNHGFFDIDSDLGQAYWEDMNFMLQFALDNRKQMMKQALLVLGLGEQEVVRKIDQEMINENHNHAVLCPEGVLHRKGATPADEGQMGVIPISMGSGVYVTRGLGNEKFLWSASHGAGRKMSRGNAKRNLDMDRFRKQMEGIVAPVNESTLDEAPDAYKDEDTIISAQNGIVVDVVDVVRPLIVVKG